jgi:hypothetical protein
MAIRSLVVPLAAVALALSGCSDDEEEEDRVDGSGYSYAVPDGWEDASDEGSDIDLGVPTTLVDSLVIGERVDDFTTNVNVVREMGLPAGTTARRYTQISLANLRDPAASGFPAEVVEQMEGIDQDSIEVVWDAELDGRNAVRWNYRTSAQGKETQIRQVSAVRDGVAYTVTLTAVPEAFEEGTEGFEELVYTWEWE